MDFDAEEKHQKILADYLLKEGDGTTLPNNEEDSTQGVNPTGDSPDDVRAKGNIDAPWGEKNSPGGKNKPVNFSPELYGEFVGSRDRMLEDFFDSKKPAQENAQAVVGSLFAHGASGDYESRAPMLDREKRASDETLIEKVRRIV
jgi:hypothetical protein